MKSPSRRRAPLALSLILLTVFAHPLPTFAQQSDANGSAQQQQQPPTQQPARTRDDIDLEMQLHLVIGSSKPGAGAKLPPSLEAAVRKVRESLQHTNFRLGGAFLHRVKNRRTLEVKGEAGALPLMLISTANLNRYTPIYYQFGIGPVELKLDDGGELVSIQNFRFGMRVPVVTSLPMVAAAGGAASTPPGVVYEDIGITTGLTVPEGQPVVVGTLYTGQEGDVIIVVLTANRVNRR